jgi:hypothetical protein
MGVASSRIDIELCSKFPKRINRSRDPSLWVAVSSEEYKRFDLCSRIHISDGKRVIVGEVEGTARNVPKHYSISKSLQLELEEQPGACMHALFIILHT